MILRDASPFPSEPVLSNREVNRAASELNSLPRAAHHCDQQRKGEFVSKQVIINLPVADLSKSIVFFKVLGYSHNPQATDDTGALIVVSDTISVMLLTHDRFRDFTPKAICDTSKAAEVLLCLSCESREEVDGLVAKAIAAGGSTYDKPEDYGFMYTHSFVDPDGHGWGLVYMNATLTQE